MVFQKPIQLLSAGVALSVVGFGLALISAAITIHGYAAKSWPTTQARVVHSEVVVSQKAAGIIRRAAVWRDYYTAKIQYAYTINGNDFIGNQVAIDWAPEGFDPSTAEAAVAKYPLGAQITISYNPRSPDSSVIDPTVSVGLWCAGIVLGLVALSAGAVFWIQAIRLDDAQKSAAQVVAAPKVVRPRLEGVVAASVQDSPIETVEVRMHWLLRTIAVLTGLAFFFFGSLALPICIKMGVPVAPNAAGPDAAGVVAYVIVISIVVGLLLLGAFLIWKGMRRSTRLVKLPSARLANFAVQPATEQPGSASSPDFGAFIAQCGPQEAGLSNYLVFGGIALVAGILCIIAPSTFLNPKPADEAAVKGFLWLFGGLSLVAGLVMMWKPLFGQNQQILLYERGIIERVGAISYGIALDEIEQLRVQEWYDHRFAPRTFNVRAEVRGDRELSFSSALRGDSGRIIAYLTEHIEKTEVIPFKA